MAAESKERPTIELYMYSLNQEFPAGKGHETYLKRYSNLQPDARGDLVLNASVESQVFKTKRALIDEKAVSDWSVQWLENRWVENHTKAIGIGGLDDPFMHLVIREEDFGAIIFDPKSDRVYRVNKPGLELFVQVREAARVAKEGGKYSVTGFSKADQESFQASLKAAGLAAL